MPGASPRYATCALAAGVLASTLLAGLTTTAAPSRADVSHRTSWQVAPGVTYRAWRFTSPAGPQRVHVLDVDPTEPGVSLGYHGNATLQLRAPTSRIVAADPTDARGTHATYFDISDTGAPDGVGRSRARGVTHAPTSGWNNAFYQ